MTLQHILGLCNMLTDRTKKSTFLFVRNVIRTCFGAKGFSAIFPQAMCTSGRYKRSQTVTRHESTAFSQSYIWNQMKDLPGPEIITPSKVINTWLLFCPDEPQIVKIQLFSESNDRDKEQGVLRRAFMSAAGAWPLPRPWPQIYTVNAFLWAESKKWTCGVGPRLLDC